MKYILSLLTLAGCTEQKLVTLADQEAHCYVFKSEFEKTRPANNVVSEPTFEQITYCQEIGAW